MMKITKSQLKQIIAEEIQEARLPAWERPGYEPEPGLGPEDPGQYDDEVLVRGFGVLRIDQIKDKLVSELNQMADAASNGEFRKIGVTRLKLLGLFLETLNQHGALGD